MSPTGRIRFVVYLCLSSLGLITAWTFNGIAVASGQNYASAWFGSAVDLVLTSDLGIVAIAAVVFMIAEAARLRMPHVWFYIVIAAVTALAFSFPLFLAMRERHLARRNHDDPDR